jgi:hypothetical protein
MKVVFNHNRKILVALFLLVLLIVPSMGQNDHEAAIQWRRWEHTITTESAERPLRVDVVFSGPKGTDLFTSAFTDDGKTYTIRMAFPEVGTWKWKTTSSNTHVRDLHNVRGKVEVVRYVGNNPLYRHGDLQVSLDRRYLQHADGAPFLWIGDTGWNAILKSNMDEWKYYVDRRADQGFTVLQVSPRGVGNRNTASENNDISFTPDGLADPVFWKNLEDKIAYANDKGLLVLLAGVGSSWRDRMAQNPLNQKFEPYIAGRLASHMVIFSPSFDHLFVDELDKVAFELKKITNHLVTQHPATNYKANLTFRNSNSVDFCGLQSGHQGGDIPKVYNAARQWTIDMWNAAPVKPVINLESMFDGYGNDDARNWRAKDSRKPAWISWFSGARGFTYGAGDIPPKVPGGNGAVWRFNKDSSSYDYWQNAIDWPSSGYMTHLGNFLKSIEWWRLVPSFDLVRNQENEDTLMMILSKTPEHELIVAYLPDNPRIVLDMSFFFGSYSSTWFNPKTGEYTPSENVSGGDQNRIFTRPDGWEDAVLKIYKP